MTSLYKECGCQGRNPNCARCNGFGMIRPQDKIRSLYVAGPSLQNLKTSRSKPKKPSAPCPYCKSWVTKMLKHVKKVHPERLLEFQGLIQQLTPLVKKVVTHQVKKPVEPRIVTKTKKPLSTCPHCQFKVSNLFRHIKKVHPERLTEHQESGCPVKVVIRKAEKVYPKESVKMSKQKASFKQPLLDLLPESNRDTLSKLGFLNCPECGAKVRKNLYEEHCKRVHRKQTTTKSSRKTCSGKRILIREKETKKSVEKKKLNKPSKQIASKDKARIKDIRLENKVGNRYSSLKECSACGAETKPTWQFIATNGKVVFICSKCKPVVFERSFDQTDALDHAFFGGMFEGNRRRH